MATDTIYAVGPEGELVFPGCPTHELLEIITTMDEAQQGKVLELLRITSSGEFDVLQTRDWTLEQRREFMDSLPEASA